MYILEKCIVTALNNKRICEPANFVFARGSVNLLGLLSKIASSLANFHLEANDGPYFQDCQLLIETDSFWLGFKLPLNNQP